MHERRVHPHAQVGRARVVRRAGGEAPGGLGGGPADQAVHVAQLAGGVLRERGRAEHDLRGHVERPVEPRPRLVAVVRVLRDPCGHERVGELEDDRRAAAEQQHALAVHPPGDAVRTEQTSIRHWRTVTHCIGLHACPDPGSIRGVSGGGWMFLWLMVVLKVPIGALLYLVWWATTRARGGRFRAPRARLERAPAPSRPGPSRARASRGPPRRGPHAEPPPRTPSRTAACARTSGRRHVIDDVAHSALGRARGVTHPGGDERAGCARDAPR